MNRNLTIIAIATSIALSGCGGTFNYVRPNTSITPVANYKIIDKPRDAIWNTSIAELGKEFFVINTIDKSSGLINISYSGDPEKYIDCGHITSTVKNMRGERTYSFPGASEHQRYELKTPVQPNGTWLFYVDRDMKLDGRANIIFEAVSPNQTKVTINTRYIVTRQLIMQDISYGTRPYTESETISFNSGGSSSFKNNGSECIATGAFEREILSVIK